MAQRAHVQGPGGHMDTAEIIGWIFGKLFVWGPSIVFGTAFLISFIREPRQFRNALFFLAFLLWTVPMVLLHLHQERPVLILFIFAIFVLPLIAVVGLLLNSIVVVRRNGLSIASLLPAALAVFIVLMLVAAYNYDLSTTPLWVGLLLILFFLEGLWFSYTYVALYIYSHFYRLLPRRRTYDYIIVHGAGLMGTELTPLLAGRVDKAVELWEHQGRAGKIIVSGGQGGDEVISEAEAMERYLTQKKDVPAEAIIQENRSTTTWENLKFSKVIMDEHSAGEPYRCAVVTSDYHVFRCAEYAHKLNIPADGVGSHTRGWYWPAAFTREFIAITKAHWWPYLVIFILWCLMCVVSLNGVLYNVEALQLPGEEY